MGYNRSGTRRTQRLKRHKKLMQRLLAKQEKQASEPKKGQPSPSGGGAS